MEAADPVEIERRTSAFGASLCVRGCLFGVGGDRGELGTRRKGLNPIFFLTQSKNALYPSTGSIFGNPTCPPHKAHPANGQPTQATTTTHQNASSSTKKTDTNQGFHCSLASLHRPLNHYLFPHNHLTSMPSRFYCSSSLL
jgi:hypothetical protein